VVTEIKPRLRPIREIMEMVRTTISNLDRLQKELDKYSEQNMQDAVHKLGTTARSLQIMAEDCNVLNYALDGDTTYQELTNKLWQLSTVLSAEYDSKFIGSER